MALEIKGNFRNRRSKVEFNLPVIKFQEDNLHFYYTPALDLTGYGHSEEEAKNSFNETLGQFFDYTINKKTLTSELKKLGWKVRGKSITVPSLTEMILANSYLAEIFEEKTYTKFHQTISLPAVV